MREATITNPGEGLAAFAVMAADTFEAPTVSYYYDVWYLDELDKRHQVVPVSRFHVLDAAGYPGEATTLPGMTPPLPGTGIDGKTVRTSFGPPVPELGADGDYAIDRMAWVIYGPKVTGVWPAGTSMIGPAGPQGASTIHSGAGAPGAGLGALGEFYFRTDTTQLYGPKGSGVWPPPVNLVGTTGAQGVPGTPGSRIHHGTDVPLANLGIDGDLYLRSDTTELYGPKASGAWPALGTSLVGPAGLDGADGKTLLTGTIPPTGGQGVDGDYFIDRVAWRI